MVIKMKKKILITGILLVIILSITGLVYAGRTLNQKTENEEKHLIKIEFSDLEEKINNKETFILLLSQESCSHCAQYKPILKKILANHNIYAYELEIDKLSNKENAKLKDVANISGTPTTIFIENGTETNTSTRLVGTKNASQIENRLKALGYIK
jgi:predicted bacteriocin transport accessory protein